MPFSMKLLTAVRTWLDNLLGPKKSEVASMADGKITDGLGNALMYGFQTGREVALASGVAGLLVTACARDWVQSLLGMKKR